MGLGLGVKGLPEGGVEVGFRSGLVRYAKIALTSAGGAAVAFAVFSILERQPVQGFGLLTSWGPWPIVVLVALAMLGGFLSKMSDTISVTFGAMVTSSQQGVEAQIKGAEAQAKTADALTRLADQGSRQAEEVQRLTIYAAQGVNGLYERMDAQDRVLEDLGAGIKGLHTKLSREKSALDAKERSGENER